VLILKVYHEMLQIGPSKEDLDFAQDRCRLDQ